MKTRIDFYLDELKPKVDPLSLNNMALAWVTTLVLACLVIAVQSWTQQSYQTRLVTLTEKQASLKRTVDELTAQLQKKQDINILNQEIATLEAELARKERIAAFAEQFQQAQTVDYFLVMKDLSEHHNPNVWLSEFEFVGQQAKLLGHTLSPEAIPQWLTGLKQAEYFSGKSFSVFEFEKSQDVVDFTVATKAQEAK